MFGRSGTCVLLVFLMASAGCAAKGKSSNSPRGGGTASAGGEASQLQGAWDQQAEEGPAATPKQRVVKQVSGDTETVTTYGPNGQVLSAHTARFKLARRGDVPVYTFYDRRNTAGPEQGRTDAAPRSFVYRLRGDDFDEVWGLLPGQEQREVVVKRWRRAGAPRR